jgi:hypothetical protein
MMMKRLWIILETTALTIDTYGQTAIPVVISKGVTWSQESRNRANDTLNIQTREQVFAVDMMPFSGNVLTQKKCSY